MPSSLAPVCAAKQLSGLERLHLVMESFKQSKPITVLSVPYRVSRKFIHEQRNKALEAIKSALVPEANYDHSVLFNIPVTKLWLKQFVTALLLNCRSSFRGVQKTAQDLLDYTLSLGTVNQYFSEAVSQARQVNQLEKLNDIKLSAHDEMFCNNSPILTGVDIQSLYCHLASVESHRDSETWAIKLMELEDQGYQPERVIADDGAGYRAGHHTVFPNTPCDGDVFHIITRLIEMRRYFRNRLKSSVTECNTLEEKITATTNTNKLATYHCCLEYAESQKNEILQLSTNIDTLVGWMRWDVLEKPGLDLTDRELLFDFIVAELKKLEQDHPHRIKEVRIALQNQRDQLLAFVTVLDDSFKIIAETNEITEDEVWQMCLLLRCKIGSENYAIRSLPLQDSLGDKYDDVEDQVLLAL